MPKTIRNEFDSKLTFDKLLEAHIRASKNKNNRLEVLKFNVDLESNIIDILNKLKNGTYKTGKYYSFIIREPKERLIKALPYRDRIVQQWYISEFIKPYIVPRFIKDTYACLENRGTHASINTTQKYMNKMYNKNKNYYILKCDIKKYFYSIDKDILYNIMKKYISDLKLLKLTYNFIYDDNNIIGIPIGNYTSQFFANIYLNELDKYIKEELKVKYYVRYMDDFICLLESKEECKIVKEKISIYLKEKLHLELNTKSRYYPNRMGINFCGYRIYNSYRLLRNRSKNKIKKNIKIWNRLYRLDKLDIKKVELSFNSFKAHLIHSNCYRFINKMYNSMEFKDKLRGM